MKKDAFETFWKYRIKGIQVLVMYGLVREIKLRSLIATPMLGYAGDTNQARMQKDWQISWGKKKIIGLAHYKVCYCGENIHWASKHSGEIPALSLSQVRAIHYLAFGDILS